MPTFEQQLVKAIKHGCPFCKGRNALSSLMVLRAKTVACWPSIGYKDSLVWPHLDEELVISQEPIRVECSINHRHNKSVLWTKEHGWIPELQEVVKGE